jgi:hypothetical protein
MDTGGDSQTWWEYGWLMLIALCASAYRLPDNLRDSNGKVRWAMLWIQLPTAFATGIVAHAAGPAVVHFLPYAGNFVVDGLTGVFAFAGPLAVPKLFDALTDIIKRRLGGAS